ncbi:hypothetical protein N4R57_16595 [Rhodobacteraceae bacterium D3-12]|nr:hypothetical protein N4R57_16595 [Rhodobacteraceae bacterium D3-12]
MKLHYLLASVATLALPAAVSAAELSYSGEASVNVAVTSGGTTETTADVIVELSYGGAFVGAELETLYKHPADDAEITLSLGYSFELGNDMALTAYYSRIYLDKSGFTSDEVGLALDFPISGNIGATLEVVQGPYGQIHRHQPWRGIRSWRQIHRQRSCRARRHRCLRRAGRVLWAE